MYVSENTDIRVIVGLVTHRGDIPVSFVERTTLPLCQTANYYVTTNDTEIVLYHNVKNISLKEVCFNFLM